MIGSPFKHQLKCKKRQILRRMMKIGAVVHGPEIVDLGLALRLLRYLKKLGEVTAVLGGTMGRLAIIDAGAENEIKISSQRRPSRSLMDLQASSDILFLINYAKSRESGLAFAAKVADVAALAKPLICIDCGGRFLGFVEGRGAVVTDDLAAKISKMVSQDLGLEMIKLPEPSRPDLEKGSTRRILHGIQPGEMISVNGTVVARALGKLCGDRSQGWENRRNKGSSAEGTWPGEAASVKFCRSHHPQRKHPPDRGKAGQQGVQRE